jgi:hypothetical protein
VTACALLRMPRRVPRCLPGAALHLRALNRLGWAIVAVGATAATVAGCATTTVAGHEVPGESARTAASLEAVLLTGTELDAALGASGMTADHQKHPCRRHPVHHADRVPRGKQHGRRAGVRRDELEFSADPECP